jgi:hypothetical protein
MGKALLIRAATLEVVTINRAGATPVLLETNAAGALDVRLMEWDRAATVSDDGGRTRYSEAWAAGSLVPADPVAVYGGHRTLGDGRTERGPLIGVLRATDSRADGLYGTIDLADTAAARDVRELARMVGAFVSIEAEADSAPAGATVVRTAERPASLTGVAVLLPPQRPAHPGAQVLAVRADSPTDPEPDPPAGPPFPDPDDPDRRTLSRGAVAEEVRTQLARLSFGAGSSAAAHPLARFRTYGEWWLEASLARSAGADEPRTLARALADQITTDNPGVVPPGWVTEVSGILLRPRRVIAAFGAFPDPGYGTEVDYPYFDGDLTQLVGIQATEKTAIVSVKLSLKKGAVPLRTIAGGSDISYQLIRRSSPSYREAYLRIMTNAYAVVSESIAANAALTAATGTVGPWVPGTGTADELRAIFFEASIAIEAATGAPAAFALASSDVFGAIGGLPGLWPAPYSTSNVAGTATAGTLAVSVSGVPVFPVPSLPAGSLLISNQEAAGWIEDGPFAVTAEDVELLGQNVAVWGMGALAVPAPAGIVKVAAAAASRSGSSK